MAKRARTPTTPFLAGEDMTSLRTQLPAYWWAEVNRVRTLIEDDAEEGLLEARHFEYAARALAQSGERESLAHARALCTASQRLGRLAARTSALHA
jgi:hypothetical protein